MPPISAQADTARIRGIGRRWRNSWAFREAGDAHFFFPSEGDWQAISFYEVKRRGRMPLSRRCVLTADRLDNSKTFRFSVARRLSQRL
jgi:hypothetical protein